MATQQILSIAKRGPITIQSANYTVPANSGFSQISFVSDVQSPDINNGNKSFMFLLETSSDGGQNFAPDQIASWVGGQIDRQGSGQLHVGPLSVADYVGMTVRVSVSLPVQVNMGAHILLA